MDTFCQNKEIEKNSGPGGYSCPINYSSRKSNHENNFYLIVLYSNQTSTEHERLATFFLFPRRRERGLPLVLGLLQLAVWGELLQLLVVPGGGEEGEVDVVHT